MRQHAAVSDRAMEDRARWRSDVLSQLGVHAVRRNDDVTFGDRAIGERHAGHVAVLRKAATAVSSVHHPGRQRTGQDLDKIGAVHSEGRVPARGVRYLDRRDRRPVVAKVAGTGANFGSPFLYRRSEPHPHQMAHAVRRQEHAGPDFAKSGRLFINRDPVAVCDQSICSEQAADAAANDHDLGSRLHHRHTVIHAPLASTDLNTASSAAAVCRMPAGEIGNAPCPSAALAK